MFEYGRYTPYVLSAYGISIAILIGITLWSIFRVINAKKKLDAIEPNAFRDPGKTERKP